MPLLALVVCYLLGSIPTAYLLAKAVKGVDIRTIGSGNVGATNALRAIGVRAGAVVLVVDAAKGLLAATVVPSWVLGEAMPSTRLLCGLVAVLGHDFPCWLGFRGGKGVATTMGVLVGSAWPVAAAAVVTWLLVFALTRYVSIGSMAAAVAIPISQLGFHHAVPSVAVGAGLAALIIMQHRANIRRLLAGTEHRARRD